MLTINVAALAQDSLVNGPGRRNVLHVQGCSVGCSGCFNKHTWPKASGTVMDTGEAVRLLLEWEPDGITISGGEPMEQWESVRHIIKEVHKRKPGINVMIFTGWARKRLKEKGLLEEMSKPFYLSRTLVSMVIAGPYIEELACVKPLISSSNQEIIYINPDCERVDLSKLPRVAVDCGPSGFVITGLPDRETLEALTSPKEAKG